MFTQISADLNHEAKLAVIVNALHGDHQLSVNNGDQPWLVRAVDAVRATYPTGMPDSNILREFLSPEKLLNFAKNETGT